MFRLDHGTQHWSVAKVVTFLETGSSAQIAQAVETIQAEVAFEPGVTTTRHGETTSNRANRQIGQHVTGRHEQQHRHRDHGHRR